MFMRKFLKEMKHFYDMRYLLPSDKNIVPCEIIFWRFVAKLFSVEWNCYPKNVLPSTIYAAVVEN